MITPCQPRWRKRGGLVLAILLLFGAALWARATVAFQVSFNDPGRKWAAYYGPITSHLQAAGQDWAQYLHGNTSLEVAVNFVESPDFLSSCASATSVYVTNDGAHDVFEQSAAAKIRTGHDANGSLPDIELQLGTNYLVNVLWFDPNPPLREAEVPTNRVDAMSVFLHELAHALVFNGWMNSENGSSAGSQQSTFDRWVRFDGSDSRFHGPRTVARHGRPVPVTLGNGFHLGNRDGRGGPSVNDDLMNGVAFTCGTRYYISTLDLEIIADCGVPVGMPELTLTKPRISRGELQFQVKGSRARWYRVEYSTNLHDWYWVMDYVSTHAAMTVVTTNAPADGPRFFRTLMF